MGCPESARTASRGHTAAGANFKHIGLFGGNLGLYFDTMHGTRSGGSAPTPGPAALQPSAAERTALSNVQAVGATVSTARRIPLPKAAQLTQLGIKVPSVNLDPRGCLTKSKRTDALASSIADDGTRAQPSRGTASELPMAGRSPNSGDAALFRTGKFQERRAARLQAASARAESTPAASAGGGADRLSATEGATPSTTSLDGKGGTKARTLAVDPVADAVAAAEQARLIAAWLDPQSRSNPARASLLGTVARDPSQRVEREPGPGMAIDPRGVAEPPAEPQPVMEIGDEERWAVSPPKVAVDCGIIFALPCVFSI